MNALPLQPIPDKQARLVLGVLQAIEQEKSISQRTLAQQMGVALGLTNSCLKRCVKKGWIKVNTAPANRYLYYLTPKGFAEKTRLTAEFLATSLTLLKQSGDVYSTIYTQCANQKMSHILLAGLSDLTEIAYMRALAEKCEIIAVWQPDTHKKKFYDLPVYNSLEECPQFDAVVLTALEQTHELSNILQARLQPEQIYVPPFLLNMAYRNQNIISESGIM